MDELDQLALALEGMEGSDEGQLLGWLFLLAGAYGGYRLSQGRSLGIRALATAGGGISGGLVGFIIGGMFFR